MVKVTLSKNDLIHVIQNQKISKEYFDSFTKENKYSIVERKYNKFAFRSSYLKELEISKLLEILEELRSL